MAYPVLLELVDDLKKYANANGGNPPPALKITPGRWEAALDEMKAWLVEHDEPLPPLSMPMDRPNFVLCGVPVVYEHA